MFIIFGHRTMTKNYGPTLWIFCCRCHNKGYADLLKRTVWFTLFFIPVIPLRTQYFLICNICRNGRELHGDEIKKALKLNEITNAVMHEGMTKEEYIAQSKDLSLDGDVKDRTWQCPKCNGTNPNDTYVCKHCGNRLI